jgi:hypothetical protein
MDDQLVESEPAAGSEADWSTGTRTTLQPPQHETGEFARLVSDAPSIEDSGLGSPEELADQMRALVGDEEPRQESEQEPQSQAEQDETDGEEPESASHRGLFRSGERGLFRRTRSQIDRLTSRD